MVAVLFIGCGNSFEKYVRWCNHEVEVPVVEYFVYGKQTTYNVSIVDGWYMYDSILRADTVLLYVDVTESYLNTLLVAEDIKITKITISRITTITQPRSEPTMKGYNAWLNTK